MQVMRCIYGRRWTLAAFTFIFDVTGTCAYFRGEIVSPHLHHRICSLVVALYTRVHTARNTGVTIMSLLCGICAHCCYEHPQFNLDLRNQRWRCPSLGRAVSTTAWIFLNQNMQECRLRSRQCFCILYCYRFPDLITSRLTATCERKDGL